MAKLTNMIHIDPTWEYDEWANAENQNFRAIAEHVGLEFARTTVTINPGDWGVNGEEKPNIDNPEAKDPNTAKIPAFRVLVTAEFPAPKTKGVWYTDVLVGPHHEDTDVFAEQLQDITQCNVILVEHSNLKKFNETEGPATAKLNLMFWAIASRPSKPLKFDVMLV